MVEMTQEEFLEELENREYQPKKPSKVKWFLKNIGGEIRSAHQFMLRQRDKASARNAHLNKLNKKGKRPKPIDFNINHAHEKIKVGW